MALTKPILNSIAAFDAANSQVFKFNVLGGSQVTGSTLTIKNNATLEQVYSESQISFKLQHVLPANILSNGTYYQAYLTTTDADGNTSPVSNTIQFYCYTQPEFAFSNIATHAVINNSSFEFQATYNQAQGEILNEYTFNLYDATGAKISTSGTKYNTSTVLPLTISYTFTGLSDKGKYSVEVVGQTSGKTVIKTAQVEFTVQYTTPNIYSYLYLTNNCREGYISIETRIKAISGYTHPDPPTYIDNKEIDLREDGSWLEWLDGYSISQPYTIRMWGRDFTENSDIITFTNQDGAIVTVRYVADNTNVWWELRAVMKGWPYGYVIMSNKIAKPTNTETMFMWLRCGGDLYDLKMENLGEVV